MAFTLLLSRPAQPDPVAVNTFCFLAIPLAVPSYLAPPFPPARKGRLVEPSTHLSDQDFLERDLFNPSPSVCPTREHGFSFVFHLMWLGFRSKERWEEEFFILVTPLPGWHLLFCYALALCVRRRGWLFAFFFFAFVSGLCVCLCS